MIMNKTTRWLLIVVVIFNVISLSALAQTVPINPASKADYLLSIIEETVGLQDSYPLPPEEVIANLVYVALGTVGLILIVLIIYGGWVWGTARGNEERATYAQNLIRNAIIGVIIIFSSFFITAFVVYKIGEVNFEQDRLQYPR